MGLLTLGVFPPLDLLEGKLEWLTIKGNSYRNPEQAITSGTKIARVYAKSAFIISTAQCDLFFFGFTM